jgi:hypothetical protein
MSSTTAIWISGLRLGDEWIEMLSGGAATISGPLAEPGGVEAALGDSIEVEMP